MEIDGVKLVESNCSEFGVTVSGRFHILRALHHLPMCYPSCNSKLRAREFESKSVRLIQKEVGSRFPMELVDLNCNWFVELNLVEFYLTTWKRFNRIHIFAKQEAERSTGSVANEIKNNSFLSDSYVADSNQNFESHRAHTNRTRNRTTFCKINTLKTLLREQIKKLRTFSQSIQNIYEFRVC